MQTTLGALLTSYAGTQDELIPILQAVQASFGYLPEQEMLAVARFTGVSASKVYGVASFYAQFRFTPVGENRIMVCRGTACHVRGARQILDELSRQLGIQEGETTSDLKYTLETAACLGCCALAPCIMINKRVQGRLTPGKVGRAYRAGDTGAQE